MAKNNQYKKRGRPSEKDREQLKEREVVSYLKSETKRAIIAVFAFAGAIFFVLARFHTGGRAGEISYQILDKLFGWGFYLTPLLLLALGVILLRSIRVGLVTTKVVSGLFFLLAVLGILSTVGEAETGGLIGNLISKPAPCFKSMQLISPPWSITIFFAIGRPRPIFSLPDFVE